MEDAAASPSLVSAAVVAAAAVAADGEYEMRRQLQLYFQQQLQQPR